MKQKYTLLGITAVLIWGLSAAFTRTLGERLGLFTSGGVVNLLAGGITFIIHRIQTGKWRLTGNPPRKYLLVCGSLYILYVVTSYIATIATQTREQVTAVVVIKFTWPVMTLLFTIPLLKARPSKWLAASCAMGLVGLVIVVVGNAGGFAQMQQNLYSPWLILPVVLGLVSAVSWSLYSVLMRKYLAGKAGDVDAIGYFLLITGGLMLLLSMVLQEKRSFDVRMVGELFFQVVLTSFAATMFWNRAMLYGNMIVVITVSNLLPVIATFCTAFVLGTQITVPVALGAALVAASTVWSNYCFTKTNKPANRSVPDETYI